MHLAYRSPDKSKALWTNYTSAIAHLSKCSYFSLRDPGGPQQYCTHLFFYFGVPCPFFFTSLFVKVCIDTICQPHLMYITTWMFKHCIFNAALSKWELMISELSPSWFHQHAFNNYNNNSNDDGVLLVIAYLKMKSLSKRYIQLNLETRSKIFTNFLDNVEFL